MRGTTLLYCTLISVLFDTGATILLISEHVVRGLGLTTEVVSQPLRVEAPVGGGLVIRHQCKGCWLSLGEVEVAFDLFVMPLEMFDVILGMDWLVAFQDKINFYRRITSMTTEGVTHTLRGEWDFEASRAGPSFDRQGAIAHTLAALSF